MLAPARDGQSVKLAHRRGRVSAQGVEKWCGVPGPDAGQHRAVQVGGVVEPVEGAVVDVRRVVGQGRDRFVGEQIQVDVRPQLPDPLAALDPVVAVVRGDRQVLGAQQRRHQRQSVAGTQRKVVADDRGLDLTVERDRGDGILDAGHDKEFELHVVGRIAQRPQAFRQAFGNRGGRIVGQQNGVELLLLRPGLKLLVGQRRKHVEQCGAVAILREQAHRQRHLVGQSLRCEIGEIAAERLQIRRARVQPVPLVGAQTIQQPLHPGRLVRGVQPGAVHDVEVMARVVEQVPGVDPGVRRIGHCRQR